MRIISKFSDYYDSAMGAGIDMSRVFVRNTEEIWKEEARHRIGHDLQQERTSKWDVFRPRMSGMIVKTKRRDIYITPFAITFCGKVYYGLKLEHVDRDYRGNSEFIYSLEQAEKLYKKYHITLHDKPKHRNFWRPSHKAENKEDLKNYLRVSNQHEQLLIDEKIAIGVYSNVPPFATFTANPCLKDFGFQKVFNPYQAFQELDMFISGVLPETDNAMLRISDKDLAKAKGFDCYSFKKEPTKHKRKVCK